MEQQRLEHEAAKLVMKLRWIGMEDEAKRLQAMVNTLRAEEEAACLPGRSARTAAGVSVAISDADYGLREGWVDARISAEGSSPRRR
jgi:hypothetical protein